MRSRHCAAHVAASGGVYGGSLLGAAAAVAAVPSLGFVCGRPTRPHSILRRRAQSRTWFPRVASPRSRASDIILPSACRDHDASRRRLCCTYQRYSKALCATSAIGSSRALFCGHYSPVARHQILKPGATLRRTRPHCSNTASHELAQVTNARYSKLVSRVAPLPQVDPIAYPEAQQAGWGVLIDYWAPRPASPRFESIEHDKD